jgi:4-hydroxythreonine-4-phosphate dehydrogenase
VSNRVLITTGEPAGIGPDVVIKTLAGPVPGAALAVAADPELLAQRARALGLGLDIVTVNASEALPLHQPGRVHCLPVPLATPAIAGQLDCRNAQAVIDMLAAACDACLQGHFQALCTAPVHKAVINEAGIAVLRPHRVSRRDRGRRAGHDADGWIRCGWPWPRPTCRWRKFPGPSPRRGSSACCGSWTGTCAPVFGIPRPRILVAGLNPHAGDGGHLGHEEQAVIGPVLERLRRRWPAVGWSVAGRHAVHATARLEHADAVLAMYHDQGLPVLKYVGFGRAVNVTLGLPIIRTSVDHGTALDIAGMGRADPGSLEAALELALQLTRGDGHGGSTA